MRISLLALTTLVLLLPALSACDAREDVGGEPPTYAYEENEGRYSVSSESLPDQAVEGNAYFIAPEGADSTFRLLLFDGALESFIGFGNHIILTRVGDAPAEGVEAVGTPGRPDRYEAFVSWEGGVGEALSGFVRFTEVEDARITGFFDFRTDLALPGDSASTETGQARGDFSAVRVAPAP